ELQTVWIEGEQVWSSAAVSGLMAENLNDKIAGAAFRDNLANEEATYNLGLDAIWGEIQSDTDARFYAAMGLSSAMYADANAASVMGDPGAYEAYAAWMGPQRAAHEAVFGPSSDSTLGQLGQIGASLGGAVGHSLWDGATDL